MRYNSNRSGSNHNTNKALYSGVGNFDIPEIYPEYQFDKNTDFVSFNYAISDKNRENHGVHFFVDDYQFDRIWHNPDAYIDMFKQYKYVLAPDFSLYTDWSKSIQIYNHYRKHWVSRYYQEHGVTIIPTIGWSDKSSFEWCFDGEPKNSVVAISSKGCAGSKNKTKAFNEGFLTMIERLNPSKVLCFGKNMDIYNQFYNAKDKFIIIPDNQIERLKKLKEIKR